MKRSELKQLISEVIEEETGGKERYKEFVRAAMKKFNVSNISDLSDEEKKEFFNYLDKGWNAGDNETDIDESVINEGTVQSPKISASELDSRLKKNPLQVVPSWMNKRYDNLHGSSWVSLIKQDDAIRKVAVQDLLKLPGWVVGKYQDRQKIKFPLSFNPLDWQLYSPETERDIKTLEKIADGFNRLVNSFYKEYKRGKNEDWQGFGKKMKQYMSKFSKYGATDTEARNVLYDVLEKIVGHSIDNLDESTLNEEMTGAIKKVGSDYFVDSNFVNLVKGVLPNSELKHAGMGFFYLQTPKGDIEFNRTSKNIPGFTGRAHQMKDTSGGKLVAVLVKAMQKSNKINEANNDSFLNEAKSYDIGMGHMGNGLVVWNRAQEVRGDYKRVAHISDDGTVKYYDKKMPPQVRREIEKAAKDWKKEKYSNESLEEQRLQYTPTKSDKISYVGKDTKKNLWWFKTKSGRKPKVFKSKDKMIAALKKVGGYDGNVIATVNQLDEYRKYNRVSGDPRWIRAKYAGTAEDGTPFKKGEKILYWPGGRRQKASIMVGKQADKEWREFQSNAADEEWMAGQFGSGMYREGVNESFSKEDIDKIKTAMNNAKNLMALPKELEKVGFSKREIDAQTYSSPMPPFIINLKRGGKRFVFLNKKYADGPDITVGDMAGGLMNESLNESRATAIPSRSKSTIEMNKKLKIGKLTRNDVFYDGKDYYQKTGWVFYVPGKGFLKFKNGGGPYTPSGGKKALQDILDQGGFLNYDSIEFVDSIPLDKLPVGKK